MNSKNAIQFIEKHGVLLVYPIQNRRDPVSLWQCFFPRLKMKWEWTDESDSKVADLWHLREELSRSGKVVYAKWFQNRATFFSHDVFTLFLSALAPWKQEPSSLARRTLRLLEENSPQSPKQLKSQLGLSGKANGAEFDRAMKELWSQLRITGFGEIDDGAFPSLAVGATALLESKLWAQAQRLKPEQSVEQLTTRLGELSPFIRCLARKQVQIRAVRSDSTLNRRVIKYEDL